MPHSPDPLRVALEIAERAGAVARRAFGTKLKVETKSDATPVTAIDRACEETVRRVLARSFPNDAILGEEYGATHHQPGQPRWIIDPIDGTKSYIRGIPNWGTLIAREERGRITVGVMNFPALGHVAWAARGRGAYLDGKRIRVSRHRGLRRAYVMHGDLDIFARKNVVSRLAALARRGATLKALGDCPAYLWLASGRAEAMVEAAMSPWDVAAPKIVVEEAGGRFTDWVGRDTHEISMSVASNSLIHASLLRVLNRRRA